MQHTFFVHFFAVVLHDYNVNLFSLPLILTLHWWPLAFLILSPPLHKIFMSFLQQKKCLLRFFISRSKSLSPFFSLSFPGQICGHDNLSKFNTLDNTDTETISAFRVRLYWLFCCLCFTRRPWLAISRQNNLELHLGCHTCWLSYFTLVCLWCGRTVSRAGGRCTVTWLPNFLGRVTELNNFCACAKTGEIWDLN